MLKPADATKLFPVACDDLKRLGARHDGGYVMPLSAIRGAKYLLSFGLSYDWTFEQAAVRENPALSVHCYDHTISAQRLAIHSLKNLCTAPVEPSRFPGALKYFSYRSFFRGRIQHHQTRIWYNHDAESITIRDAFGRLTPRGGVVVKMNIEGSEYRVLHDLAEFAQRTEAMLIVFHHIDMMAEQFDTAINAIKRDFYIVHVHANNMGGLSPSGLPNVLEITFLHRRLFDSPPARSARTYPVLGLDAKSDPTIPDLKLHFGE